MLSNDKSTPVKDGDTVTFHFTDRGERKHRKAVITRILDKDTVNLRVDWVEGADIHASQPGPTLSVTRGSPSGEESDADMWSVPLTTSTTGEQA